MNAVQEEQVKVDDVVAEEMVEEFPIPVSEDYPKLVVSANKMVCIIREHLRWESKLQGRDLSVGTLCPEQMNSLAADIETV
jgi:hypothetical protein